MDAKLNLIILVVGIAFCLGVACLCLKRCGMKPLGVAAFAPLAVLLGLFFAHLCYCLCRFTYAFYDMMPNSFPGAAFLCFWDGNYMLYGGVLGVILALVLARRIGGGNFKCLLDELSPWGALCIAFVRFYQGMAGGFYSLELVQEEDEMGEWLPSPFEGLPFSVYDDYYEVWHWALFVPAILIALILFVILLKKTGYPAGDRALLLAGMYACGQIIMESLRRDDVLRWGFVRCSQLISALLALAVLIAYFCRAKKGFLWKKLAAWLLFAIGIGVCFVMEFAQEQRIAALLFLSTGSCYLVSALSCCLIAFSLLCMRSMGNRLPKKGA